MTTESNPKDATPPQSSKNLDSKPKSQKDLDTSIHQAQDDEKSKRAKEEADALKVFEEQLNKMFELPKEPVPEDPQELLEFSIKRTTHLEGIIETMRNFMVKEEARHLDQRTHLLNLQDDIKGIQAREKLSLEEKVKDGMRSQLEDVAKQILKLEAERDKYKSKMTEYEYLIAELDGLVRHYNAEETKNLDEIEIQKQMIENYKKVIAELQKQIALKDGENLEKTANIKKLTQEVEEMKGVLFKLNDVRLVLNRVMEPYSSK